MRFLLLGPWCLAASLALMAGPQPLAVDLSGTWKGSFTLASTGLSLQDLVITLRQSGRKVDGTLLMPKFRSPMVLNGTYSKGRLRLVSPPTRGLAVTLEARVKDPNKVKGIAILDYDSPSLNKRRDRTVLEMSR
jgi:hypothetical protein